MLPSNFSKLDYFNIALYMLINNNLILVKLSLPQSYEYLRNAEFAYSLKSMLFIRNVKPNLQLTCIFLYSVDPFMPVYIFMEDYRFMSGLINVMYKIHCSIMCYMSF